MTRNSTLLAAVLSLFPFAGAAWGQTASLDVHGDPLPAGATARLGTVRFRHDATIVFAAFLPGGKGVVSASEDGVVCAWEYPSGKEMRRVPTLAGAGGVSVLG